jgi:hypothetical protein
LNITNAVELGIDETGSAKGLWDSIISGPYRQKTSMGAALAKAKLNALAYSEGQSMKDHFKALRVLRRNVIDTGGTCNDDEFMAIAIRSLPVTMKYITPTLHTLSTITDIENLLSITTDDDGSTMRRGNGGASSVFAATIGHRRGGCTNPNCKARNPETHTVENCYWPGGGKEGQFPPGFGRANSNANTTDTQQHTAAMVQHMPHLVL